MRLHRVAILLGAFAVLSVHGQSSKSNTPPKTAQELTQRVIDAHGGMERWRSAPTVSFERKMVFADPNDPWISIEVTEQGGRRRTYQDWPRDKARVAYDGATIWTLNWKRGPVRYNVNAGYYFLNLPWLTQDPGVQLTGPGKARLPGGTVQYWTLRMSFANSKDYYILYIDPGTYRWMATGYLVPYFDPPGEFIHVFEKYQTADGLTLPVKYHTYNTKGIVMARHEISQLSFRVVFDEKKLQMPSGAVVAKE